MKQWCGGHWSVVSVWSRGRKDGPGEDCPQTQMDEQVERPFLRPKGPPFPFCSSVQFDFHHSLAMVDKEQVRVHKKCHTRNINEKTRCESGQVLVKSSYNVHKSIQQQHAIVAGWVGWYYDMTWHSDKHGNLEKYAVLTLYLFVIQQLTEVTVSLYYKI